MKILGFILMAFVSICGAGCATAVPATQKPAPSSTVISKLKSTSSTIPNAMQLTSPAFKQNDELPVQYTCDGAGLHPPLEFKDAPTGTRSFVLIMDDPDAPSGTFDHWIVFNIPPQTTSMTDAPGISGKNSAGRTGYVAACPPDGQHRYIFHVFALDMMLDLKAGASRQEVEQTMSGHVLDQAELSSVYRR